MTADSSVREAPSTPFAAILLLYCAVMFSGLGGGYIRAVKFDLTPLDGIAACCCFMAFLTDKWALVRIRAVVPFVVYAVVYFAWGTVVAHDPSSDVPRIINHLILIPLIAMAAAIALSNRERLSLLADLIQLVAIVNAVVCVLQISDTSWVSLTARPTLPLSHDEMTFISFRAIGLWGNQNEAARFFVYSFLLSFWARRTFAWPGRLACLIGIYLTASRFGALMLLFSIAAVTMYMLAKGELRVVVRSVAFIMIAATAVVLFGFIQGSSSTLETLVGKQELTNMTLTRWTRLTNLEDTFSDPRTSHATLNKQGLSRALNGPWLGAGVYSFQRPEEGMLDGVHNMYLMMWGETGIWGLVAYPLLIGFGVFRVWTSKISGNDRALLLLLWVNWIAAGFASHVDLESPTAFVLWSLLFALPTALTTTSPQAMVPLRRYRHIAVAS